LPDPVTLKRLLAPEWVLFFGMVCLLVRRAVLRAASQWSGA
jgi:hypothetical protein